MGGAAWPATGATEFACSLCGVRAEGHHQSGYPGTAASAAKRRTAIRRPDSRYCTLGGRIILKSRSRSSARTAALLRERHRCERVEDGLVYGPSHGQSVMCLVLPECRVGARAGQSVDWSGRESSEGQVELCGTQVQVGQGASGELCEFLPQFLVVTVRNGVRQRHDWRDGEFLLDVHADAGGLRFSGFQGGPGGHVPPSTSAQ
jgi:hypothetical protein